MEEYKKDFDKWNEYAKKLDSTKFDDFFYVREIWWCALGVNIGSEQDGKNDDFVRPVLIIKKINQELLCVVPLTSKIIDNEYRVVSGSTGITSQIILSQIRSVSSRRLLRKISKVKIIVFFEVIIKLSCLLLGVIKNETPP